MSESLPNSAYLFSRGQWGAAFRVSGHDDEKIAVAVRFRFHSYVTIPFLSHSFAAQMIVGLTIENVLDVIKRSLINPKLPNKQFWFILKSFIFTNGIPESRGPKGP